MLEIALTIGLVVGMARLAAADDRSPILWGVITLSLCALALFIPFPFFRMLIVAVVVFLAMIVAKVMTK